ncbi:MAG: hypothetical protein ACRD1U_04290 [Vicinamibacterales bacterium]
MAEVLVEYTEFVFSPDGTRYLARACGSETANGTWQGWLEFVPPEGGETQRTGRETTQPNRTDTLYWATGLTAVYLEGALDRALHPHKRPARHTGPSAFGPPTEPAPDFLPDAPQAESVLNPFSVYRKGETLLRRQLAAFSVWHLVNIIRAHALSDLSATTLESMSADDLIEIIVTEVKKQNDEPVSR